MNKSKKSRLDRTDPPDAFSIKVDRWSLRILHVLGAAVLLLWVAAGSTHEGRIIFGSMRADLVAMFSSPSTEEPRPTEGKKVSISAPATMATSLSTVINKMRERGGEKTDCLTSAGGRAGISAKSDRPTKKKTTTVRHKRYAAHRQSESIRKPAAQVGRSAKRVMKALSSGSRYSSQ